MAGGFFTELFAATHPPRKNPALPQGKLLAFSLPHDSQSRVNVRCGSFWRTGFKRLTRLEISYRAAPTRSPQRLGTPHKCFNRHRIFDATRCLAAPCDLNACSGAVFRAHRRARGRGLPLVCRNAPEVRRKTCPSGAARRLCSLSASADSQFVIRRNRIFCRQCREARLDCFVASAPRNDGSIYFVIPSISAISSALSAHSTALTFASNLSSFGSFVM